jgi:hypothetical protein
MQAEAGTLYKQQRGQLMGNLTSFPLLCLVNYITFRYCVRREGVPVRINGDDIVFRALPAEVERWERGVAKGGLTLSKGKTLKDPRFFTLNSALFEGGTKKTRSVGFLRPRALWKDQRIGEAILSMNSRFYSFAVGMGRERTRLAREFFVGCQSKAIHASRRSLTRGLGLSVDQGILRSQGLWHRELFYLEQAVEPPLPCLVKGGVPDGFVQVSKHHIPPDTVREQEALFQERLVSWAWSEPFDPDRYDDDSVLQRIREGCSPYGLAGLNTRIPRRMLKLSRKDMWHWIYSRTNTSVFGRVGFSKEKRVWVSEDLLRNFKWQVQFVKPI